MPSADSIVFDVGFFFAIGGKDNVRVRCGKLGVNVSATLCDVALSGVVRVSLYPLTKAWPCAKAATVSFIGTPDVSFSLRAGRIPLTSLPGLAPFLVGSANALVTFISGLWSLRAQISRSICNFIYTQHHYQ
jgi:hypothetical protein